MTALQATPWKPQVVTLQATAKAGRAAQTLQRRLKAAERAPSTLQQRQTQETELITKVMVEVRVEQMVE